MTTRYVPILKGRAGELEALRLVQLRTRQAMMPLVEVAPKDETDSPASVAKICRQTVGKLAKCYPDPIMLDGGLLDLSAAMDGGRGVVALLADEARSQGLLAHPVLRIGDPARALQEAAEAHSTDGRGLTIRLVGEDLDEDPNDLDDGLEDTLAETGTGRGDVDLLIDVGAVDGDVAVRGGARLVLSLLRDLPKINEWRTVTVAAGAFPVDLSQFAPNVIGERPRYDAQLFDRVRSKRTPHLRDRLEAPRVRRYACGRCGPAHRRRLTRGAGQRRDVAANRDDAPLGLRGAASHHSRRALSAHAPRSPARPARAAPGRPCGSARAA